MTFPTPVRKHVLCLLVTLTITLAISAACSGPDTADDRDPTPTPTLTPTPVPPTATATATLTPTPEPTATATPSPTATATVAVASPTSAGSPTAATAELKDMLAKLAEMPGEGYTIAEEGSRTAQDLAAAYADPAAHLARLTEWGFKAHVYRDFVRTSSSADDPLSFHILSTINVYGSPEQADAALAWLKSLGISQGAQEADAPAIGDSAVAITQPTSTGIPTASIYVRDGETLFVYFAEGGKPLDAIVAVATKVFSR